MSNSIDVERRRLLGAGTIALAGARLGLYHPLSPRQTALSHLRAANELNDKILLNAWRVEYSRTRVVGRN